MAVFVSTEEQFYAFVKGAPKTIQERLNDIPAFYVSTYKKYTRQGSHILALAYKPLPDMMGCIVESGLTFAGFTVFNCPIRGDFFAVLLELKQSSHDLIMITGDQALTSFHVALQQNQKDVNEAMRLKKKSVVVTFDPLALIAVKTKVNKSKEKVVASSDSEGSGADDFSELKKITALLAKAFNQRKFYSKPRNNNLRTSSTSKFVNKKQEFVKSDDKKEDKKSDEKKRDMSKVKCYNCKKEGHFAKDCKKEKEINANMVFMAQIKKVLSDSETSSSSADEKISENKDKKNRLMRIDELHKFSDGTLTDVRTALDDRLKGIRMQYLPQSIWKKSDKDRGSAMIQAIDKRLKTRRIMRSLERFVGGRLYEGDFMMLQRTI
nr:probable manganese-transporting ATPase PDR2 [Tanacetum cinerariifolium]